MLREFKSKGIGIGVQVKQVIIAVLSAAVRESKDILSSAATDIREMKHDIRFGVDKASEKFKEMVVGTRMFGSWIAEEANLVIRHNYVEALMTAHYIAHKASGLYCRAAGRAVGQMRLFRLGYSSGYWLADKVEELPSVYEAIRYPSNWKSQSTRMGYIFGGTDRRVEDALKTLRCRAAGVKRGLIVAMQQVGAALVRGLQPVETGGVYGLGGLWGVGTNALQQRKIVDYDNSQVIDTGRAAYEGGFTASHTAAWQDGYKAGYNQRMREEQDDKPFVFDGWCNGCKLSRQLTKVGDTLIEIERTLYVMGQCHYCGWKVFQPVPHQDASRLRNDATAGSERS